MNILIVIILVLSIPSFGYAQSFLEKKCNELNGEIQARQKDLADQQVYLAKLQNDYNDCSQDKKDVEDAKAVLSEAMPVNNTGTNWSSLDANPVNAVNNT